VSDHERWQEDIPAYALGALEPERAEELERHLASCERCRRDVRWLTPAVAALAEAVPPRQPPPRLRERLLDEVRPEPREASARMRWRPLVAGVAVLAVLAVGFLGYKVGSGGSKAGATYTGSGHGVLAELVCAGSGAELTLAHVHQLPPGGVLEAWVQREGRVEPVKGLFVPDREGNATTAIADMSGVDLVMVTREPRGGTSAPSGEPLVSVPISD